MISYYSIITPIVSGAITSIVSVKLSYQKFKKEKLWEEKKEIYNNILMSCHIIKQHLIEEESYIIGQIDFNSISEKYCYNEYLNAMNKLYEIRDLSTFIFNKKISNLLSEYLKNSCCVPKTNDDMAYNNKQFDLITDLLKKIEKIGIKR